MNRRIKIYLCISGMFIGFLTGCSEEQKPAGLYVDALLLRQQGDSTRAIKKLEESVNMDEDFSLAFSMLGNTYNDINNYPKSANAYKKAAKLNPWSFDDHYGLGGAYQKMEKYPLATNAYDRACQIDSNHLQAHVNNTVCYYKIKDYENTLVYGTRAEQIDPDASEIHSILGDSYESKRDYEQAIRSYKRAIETDGDNVDTMVSLAVAYLKTGRSEPAEQLLDSVIIQQPENNTAWQYRGYSYLLEHGRVKKLYGTESDKDSSDPNTIAALRSQLEDILDKSIESYQKAVSLNPKDWQACRGLGVAYALKSNADKDKSLKKMAIEQWQRSLKIKPDQPRRKKLLNLITKYSD